MFENEIERLIQSLDNDPNSRGKFVFGEIQPTYAVVGLANGTIGNSICHYEVRKSHDNAPGREVYYSVEVHFEGNEHAYEPFTPLISNLPEIDAISFNTSDICRRLRGNKHAIRYGKGLPTSTKNIVDELKGQLVSLDKAIGGDLQRIIANM